MKKEVMKRTLLLFTSLIIGLSSFSQEEQTDDSFQTIGSGSGNKTRVSGVAAVTMSFGQIGNDFAHMMGGSIGVIVNDLFVGGYGMGKTNNIPHRNDPDMLNLSFGHGGLWLGYTFLHNKAIHPVIHTQLGWGNISSKEGGADFGSNFDADSETSDQVFVINPTIEVEFNFSRFFKVGIGGNYPLVYNIDPKSLYSASDFNKPAVFLSFKFGWFK